MSSTHAKIQVKKPMKKKPKAKSYEARCKEYIDAERATLERLHLAKTLLIGFRGKKSVPFLSNIAIFIIKMQGGEVHSRIDDVIPQK